jgi:hypothetical protein
VGDIEMIKWVLLAWKLCGKWLDVGGVVVLRGDVGIGVYRGEEGKETNKYKAYKCNHKA